MLSYGGGAQLKCVWGWVFSLVFFGAANSAAQTGAPAGPEANPGRPTVSTPATLPPVGYLQFENGALFADSSTEFSRRFGVNQVTKLSVLPRLEVFLELEPLVVSQPPSKDDTAARPGDVFAGLQGVLFRGHDTTPTVSVSYTRRLYASPAPDVDIGSFRQSASVLVSNDFHGFHVDANGIVTEQIEGEVHRAQFGQTLSISRAIRRFTVSGEIWHFSQPFERGNAVGNLWALSYAVRKNLVLDAGFDHGFTRSSTQWETFLGFTYLLPHRLWPEHSRRRTRPTDSAE